jgi:hypothetical protein
VQTDLNLAWRSAGPSATPASGCPFPSARFASSAQGTKRPGHVEFSHPCRHIRVCPIGEFETSPAGVAHASCLVSGKQAQRYKSSLAGSGP